MPMKKIKLEKAVIKYDKIRSKETLFQNNKAIIKLWKAAKLDTETAEGREKNRTLK